MVQTPRGERYTRNGALQINATGELVTIDGDQVLGDSGPIVFQPTDRDISISTDGTITVREGASHDRFARAASCGSSSFAQPQQLQKDGASTFAAPDGVDAAGRRPTRSVVQGAIEKSNVRARDRDDAHDRGHARLHRRSPACCSSRATCAAARSSKLAEVPA